MTEREPDPGSHRRGAPDRAAVEETRDATAEATEDAQVSAAATGGDADATVAEPSDDTLFSEPGAALKNSPFYLGFVGGTGALLAFWLGGQILSISSVLTLILVAMFLAVGLNPLVEFFMRRGITRTWAVLLVIIGVLAAIAMFVLSIAPVVSDQVTTITERVPDWFGQLQNNATIEELDAKYDVIARVQTMIEDGEWTNQVFGGVLGVGVAVVSALVNAFIVIVLTLYFLASLPSIKHFAYQLAPASRRDRVTDLGDRILDNVGGYVLGAFIVALCAGASSLVFLFIVGLGEYAVALSLVVALLDVIPMIGATLGAIIVTAIGFATDPKIGLACLIFYVLYQQFENYAIYPKVMARSVDIPGSLIVIAALVGAGLLGVIGALLAIPTAAAVQLLLKEVFLRRQAAR